MFNFNTELAGMTRLQQELSGKLGGENGAYWKREAEKKIDKVRKELEDGEITIDENGVAYNCIGRVVVEDVLEMLTYVTDKVNVEATKKAADAEFDAFLTEYRKNARPATGEQLAEMRAAFGPGEVVVDVLTGQEYYL